MSCPLIAEESVHDWPSGREKLTWMAGFTRSTLITASLAMAGMLTDSVPVWTPPPTVVCAEPVPRHAASA